MARDFDWAVWVGFRPGVRDTAGSVAIEAIGDFLERQLDADEAAYTSKLYVFQDARLDRSQVETIATELLANDIIQQWRIYSPQDWDPQEGIRDRSAQSGAGAHAGGRGNPHPFG